MYIGTNIVFQRIGLTLVLFVAYMPLGQAQTSEQPQLSHIQTLLSTIEVDAQPPEVLLAPWIRKDTEDGARNRVLNEIEAGLTAFTAGYFIPAEVLLSDAQQQIETIYANNANAQAARSKFVPEANKDFKGDPYERAMVGYYLGLIDLSKGDYDNARAGFRFAQLQDTMSASESYQDDMALMQYLVGWSYWCEGNFQSAKEEFTRAQAIRSALKPPQIGDNLLMIGEIGNAPVKFTSGKYNELLNYRAGDTTPERQLAFSVSGKQMTGVVAEDLYFQASTRGGTAVENIRAGKASFRQGAETISNTASSVTKVALGAAYLSSLNGSGKTSRELLAASLVTGAVSLISDSVAKKTETTADSRSWNSLPAEIRIATASAAPETPVDIGFFGIDGKLLRSQTMLKKTSPKKQCTLSYARSLVNHEQSDAVLVSNNWEALPPITSNVETVTNAALVIPDKSTEISDEGAALLDMVRMMRENPNTVVMPTDKPKLSP